MIINSLPTYLYYISEKDDGEISIDADAFVDDIVNSTDFYLFANKIFKEKIGDNIIYSNYYNECCQCVMGSYSDFCGKFNRNYYEIAYNKLSNNMDDYIKNRSDNFVKFFNTIFKETIYTEYMRILNKYTVKINQILKTYERVDKNKCDDDCSICTDKLRTSLSIKPPCGHIIHRKCLKKWFFTAISCPLCNTKFSNN
jgi:hypothetical protein